MDVYPIKICWKIMVQWRPGVRMGEGGGRQPFTASGVPLGLYGETWAFLWQLLLLFQAHMCAHQWPEPDRMCNQNNGELPVCSRGVRGTGAPRPPHTHTTHWTARLPTARLPFCGGKKPRVGSTGCGVSLQKGINKPARIWDPQIFMHHMEQFGSNRE